MTSTPSSAKKYAIGLILLTIVAGFIGMANIMRLAGDDTLHSADGKGDISLSTAGLLYFLLTAVTINLLLQLSALRQARTGKKLHVLITTGSILNILFILLIGCFYYLALEEDTRDASLNFMLQAACGLCTVLVSGYTWRNDNRRRVTAISAGVAIIVALLFLFKTSFCHYWRSDGHHITYYSNGKKAAEYTMECGNRTKEAVEWYESGQLSSYTLYGPNGVIDSSISYFENGKVKDEPYSRRAPNAPAVQHTEYGTTTSEREYDSAIDGKSNHLKVELLYDQAGKLYSRHIHNFTTNTSLYQRYYKNGRVSFTNQTYINALTDPANPNRVISRFGTWYKYDTTGRVIDKIDAGKQQMPGWWENPEK